MVRLPGRLISNTGYESCDSVSSVRRYEVWNMIRGSLLGVLRDMRHDSGKFAVASPRYIALSLSRRQSHFGNLRTLRSARSFFQQRGVLPATMLCSCTTLMHETHCSSSKSDDRQVCNAHPAGSPRASVLDSGSYLASSNHSFDVFIQLIFYITNRYNPIVVLVVSCRYLHWNE